MTEPRTIEEAMASPDAHEWQIAIESELESLRINGTWTLVDLATGSQGHLCALAV